MPKAKRPAADSRRLRIEQEITREAAQIALLEQRLFEKRIAEHKALEPDYSVTVFPILSEPILRSPLAHQTAVPENDDDKYTFQLAFAEEASAIKIQSLMRGRLSRVSFANLKRADALAKLRASRAGASTVNSAPHIRLQALTVGEVSAWVRSHGLPEAAQLLVSGLLVSLLQDVPTNKIRHSSRAALTARRARS